MAEPRVEQLDLPKEYGTPKKLLEWADVSARIEKSFAYWLATTRPDGRPHVMPRDGIWVDDVLYYGGSPKTVHNRNIDKNPNVVMHLEDAQGATIVEGVVEIVAIPPELAEKLAAAQNAKYPMYGVAKPEDYTKRGSLALKPKRVIAWNLLFEDATRFTFE